MGRADCVCERTRLGPSSVIGGRRDLGPRHRMWRVLNKIIALRKGRVLLEYVAYVMSGRVGVRRFSETHDDAVP